MAAPRVFKSTDVDAPILNGVIGSLIALLDAVLITGYGSQAALGWTKEFSGTNKAVYRPSLGVDRLFYRFSDSYSAGAYISMYESMSSVDVGSGLIIGDVTTESSGAAIWSKSNTADTVARTWVIIGDGYGLWFFVIPGNSTGTYYHNTHTVPHYIGQPIDTFSLGNCGMMLNTLRGSGADNRPDDLFNGVTTTVTKVHRSVDGVTLGVKAKSDISAAVGNSVRLGSGHGTAYPYMGQLILSQEAYIATEDNIAIPRIKMPGLKIGAHTSIGLTPFEMLPESTFMVVHPVFASGSYPNETYGKRFWAIDIGEGYRP